MEVFKIEALQGIIIIEQQQNISGNISLAERNFRSKYCKRFAQYQPPFPSYLLHAKRSSSSAISEAASWTGIRGWPLRRLFPPTSAQTFIEWRMNAGPVEKDNVPLQNRKTNANVWEPKHLLDFCDQTKYFAFNDDLFEGTTTMSFCSRRSGGGNR